MESMSQSAATAFVIRKTRRDALGRPAGFWYEKYF